MLKRFLVGLGIIGVTVGFFALRFVSNIFLDVFILAIALLSIFEVCKAFNNNHKFNDTIFIMSYPILCYLTLIFCKINGYNLLVYFAINVFLALLIFAITLIVNLVCKAKINKEMVTVDAKCTYKQYAVKKSLLNMFLTLYPAFVVSLLFVVNHLKDFSSFASINVNIEFMLLVIIFVATMATDTMAYLIGSAFGGKKLCPKISPNKTIIGSVAGLLGAVAFSLILFVIFSGINSYSALFQSKNITVLHFALLGLVISVFTQIGDIVASVVKRKNGIKDYGKILPGHGGIMDRVDGLMFSTIPALIFAFIFLI